VHLSASRRRTWGQSTRHVQFVSILITSQLSLAGIHFATSLQYKMTSQRQYYNFLNDSTLCYTNTHITTHIKNKLKVTDTRAIFHFRDAIMHTTATRRRGDIMLLIALHLLLPLHPDITKGWHLLVKLGTVQLFSVAYWRKKINQYVNIFVTNIIWAFVHVYITDMCH
jgi:hypothetical protein